MGCCLTELGKICMEKSIDKALAELRHVFCFTCIANEFEEEKVWLEAEIKTLDQRVKVAAGRDEDVPAIVHYWKEKADKLVQEDIKTKQTCFFELCPDCIWRYKKGKELANNIEEIKRLKNMAENFENIELPRRLPDVERYSFKDYIPFPSRDSKYKELLDALKDENNYMIGLQGMGGTGKTALAKKVGQELKLSGQFAHVIFTTLSFTPDTKKIQDDIAGPLGLEWKSCSDKNRPGKLWSRLTNGEKVLLIVDDVWDQDPLLDFDLIGIPKKDNHNGCKVLITTRSKRIFNIMGCDKMIKLDLISKEEAWTMFKLYAGITNGFSKSLIIKGRKIVEECKRLPVVIAVIASRLKGQQDRKHVWDVTLKSLKKHVAMENVDDEKRAVYKCLKSSYDYMKDEKAKELFLLSSLFPEDKEIPIEILTRLGIGTGLFGEDYDSYNDARNKVVVTKNKLIDSCLLLEVNEEQVKMHDLVREAAHWIAYKEIRSVNLSNKDQKSSIQREKNIKYLFCEGKDIDLFSCKYDGSKLEILVADIQSDEDSECMDVPNSFFENVGKLQVLYFSGHDKRPLSLPDSIQSLANIRSILVDGIDLGNISVLGNLQSLETLDLVKCIIDELPNEISNLGKFKLLNLEKCDIRRNDPFVVIKRCSTLEELYFIDSFNDFCREITLPQLQRYHILKGWNAFDNSLSKYVSFEAGDSECFFSKETFDYCMQTTEGLQLDGIEEGWRNLMPDIVPIDLGMKDLVELHLSCISQLQCLIDTTGSQVSNLLSKLVVLKLYKMDDLKELFKGFLPFDYLKNLEELSIIWCKKLRRLFSCKLNLCNLKNVKVRECPSLVNLSPLLTSRNLVLLENLEIVDCERLTSIIIDERGEEESREEIDGRDEYTKSHVSMFPKLKVLVIERCHLLESIFPFLSSQDFPVLETLRIGRCDELKYIFGQYQHVEFNSLKEINLGYLPKFMGMFPKYSHSMSSHVNESSSTSRVGFEVQTQVDTIKCNLFSWSCICCHGNSHRHKLGSMSTTKIPSPSVHVDPLQNNSSNLLSKLIVLYLYEMDDLEELFNGSISFDSLKNLEVLSIHLCKMLRRLFNCKLNLCNLKTVRVRGCPLLVNLSPLLTSQNLVLLEYLEIVDCEGLSNIIIDERGEEESRKEIDDGDEYNKSYVSLFPKLKVLAIEGCHRLESILPFLSSKDFPVLEALRIRRCDELKYIFGQHQHVEFNSLKEINLGYLPKFMGMFPKYSHSMSSHVNESSSTSRVGFEVQTQVDTICCHGNSHRHKLGSMSTTKIPSPSIHVDPLQNNSSESELSGSIEHVTALEGQPMKLKLQMIELQDLHCMTCLFVGPKNSFAQQNLTRIEIVRCEILEIIFTTSILRCLSQLVFIKIEECKELKHIIKDDDRQNQNLSQRTCFPKLEAIVVIQCHKLKSVFSVSICKELPELKALWISETNELVEIFKNAGDQKVEIPNINCAVLIDLPSLFHAQGIQLQTARNRFVHNCQKLSLPSAYSPSYRSDIRSLNIDDETKQMCHLLFKQIRRGEIGHDTGNENPSATTTKDVGIEVEAALGHKFTSAQIQMEQTLEEDNEFVKSASDLETTSVAILPTNSKELEKEQPRNQQGLINQQHILEEINTTIEPSQELEKEQPTSQQGLINQQDPLGEIDTSIKPSQEQDVRARDSQETTKTNDDQVPLNQYTIMKVSSNIEEEFPKGDEFTFLKYKPSPRNSVPLPLAFQTPSMHFEGNPSQKVEDLSSPYQVTRELEELVSTKHLDYENLSLLTDFLVKHPSILLRDTSLSNRNKGYAYNCLAELLKFLQTHSVLDVLGSNHSKFVELLHDARRCDFDKDWLDGVEKRVFLPDLQFSQDALEKVLDSKKQVTKVIEVVRFKIGILTQNVEELKQQLSSSEAELESIVQQEKEIVESKAALCAPLGY